MFSTLAAYETRATPLFDSITESLPASKSAPGSQNPTTVNVDYDRQLAADAYADSESDSFSNGFYS